MENIFKEPDLSSQEVVQNPYPHYEAIKSIDPIYKSETIFNGCWLIFDYEDIIYFLKDTTFVSSKRERYLIDALPIEEQNKFDELIKIHSQWYVHYDPPEHTRIRKIMGRGFSKKVLQKLEIEISDHIETILNKLDPYSTLDITEEISKHVPLLTITALLGVDLGDVSKLSEWIDGIAAYMGAEKPNLKVIENAQNAIISFRTYFEKVLDERAKNTEDDDMLSLLIAAHEKEDNLTRDELFAQCSLVAFAGNETTKNLISTTLYLLLNEPGLKEEVMDNKKLIPQLIDESLRYENPVQFVNRIVKQDYTYKGHEFKKGDYIAVMLGAGNRDEKVFTAPDEFNIHRNEGPHLSFGPGIHSCIGQVLAKMEAKLTLNLLLDKYPEIQLAEKSFWRNNPGLRGLKTVNVKLNP
ncbi:MAG: cytochrome P450 [Crocinitomix sp.]|nr:cytochrome P450 [Crocinitomix sp.]